MSAADLLITLNRTNVNIQDIRCIAKQLISSPEEKLCFKKLGENLDGNLGENDARDKAQNAMDNLQWILDNHGINNDGAVHDIRKELRRALSKLCKTANMYPSQIYITDLIWDESGSIGCGSYSDVYVMSRASQHTLRVSVKRLRMFGSEPSAEFRELRRDLCREAMLFRQLRHPRINEMLGVYIQLNAPRQHLSVISAYCEGGNLIEYQKAKIRTGITVDPVPLLGEIAEGLAWLHGENVVHGDVKGGNVIIDRDGHIKIIDFGISVVLETTEEHTGVPAMTRLWAAPEMHHPHKYGFEKAKASPKTDVYSLAHTMVECYTLEKPNFQQTLEPETSKSKLSIFEITTMIVDGKRPLRPTVQKCHGRTIPDQLWKLIEKSWDNKIEGRPDMITVYEGLISIARNIE